MLSWNDTVVTDHQSRKFAHAHLRCSLPGASEDGCRCLVSELPCQGNLFGQIEPGEENGPHILGQRSRAGSGAPIAATHREEVLDITSSHRIEVFILYPCGATPDPTVKCVDKVRGPLCEC